MNKPLLADSLPKGNLDQITTRWSTINDPLAFVMRYAPAIRNYLEALIKHSHDAEEVAQEFLLRVCQHGFERASPDRGRFRDYVKRAAHNAGLNFLRGKKPVQYGDSALAQVPSPDDASQWLDDWRRCLLDRAWVALDGVQRRSSENQFYNVLRLAVARPQDDSKALAARLSRSLGRSIRPDAFRKQLSRARRTFAQLLVEEVAQTLDAPTPEAIEEELISVGLLPYIREFLPTQSRTHGIVEPVITRS